MGDSAIDYADLTRICEFTRALHRPHHLGGDEVIEREFNAVCRAVWGYNRDDFYRRGPVAGGPDSHTRERATDFAARTKLVANSKTCPRAMPSRHRA